MFIFPRNMFVSGKFLELKNNNVFNIKQAAMIDNTRH